MGMEIQKIYNLSPMQEGMLFHSLLDKTSSAYFEQISFEIRGELDITSFEMAINRLIERYEILRTNFIYEGIKQPQQVVLKKRTAKVYYENISSLSDNQKKNYIKDFEQRDREKGFDLVRELLIRVSILQIESDSYQIIWGFHHIIADGWCLGIIIKDFKSIYDEIKYNNVTRLEKVVPYSNYIKWLDRQDRAAAKSYWREYLVNYEHKATFLQKRKNVNKNDSKFDLAEFQFTIPETLKKGLEELAYSNRVTLNTIFQTVWGILLQRYNNTNDVVFGAVVSGRPAVIEGIEKMVGLFINTVPIRIQSDDNESFIGLAKRVQQASSEAEQFSYISLAETQSTTELRQGLIDNILVFENYPMEKEATHSDQAQKAGFYIHNFRMFEQTNYDFYITIVPGGKLLIKLSYNANLYDHGFIKKVGEHLQEIIIHVLDNPEAKVGQLNILTSIEKQQIIHDFNSTQTDYPQDKTIHQLFEEQVEKTPYNIAVICENSQITFLELNKRANQLARKLRDIGVKPDSIVAIMVERSFDMIIGVLSVLKAGGAYLPIDPQNPEERIKYILEDSRTNILLTQSKWSTKAHFGGNIIFLEEENNYRGESENLTQLSGPEKLAYVIYTSGSTGNPKGVMIEHHSLVNRLNWMQKSYMLKEIDVILQKTPYTFDVSVWEILWWSMVGSKVCMLTPGGEKEPEAIVKAIENCKVTTLHFVPSMLNAFLDYIEAFDDEERISSLVRVFASGEALNVQQVKRFHKLLGRKYGVKLYNLYGPTEAAIDVSFFECSSAENMEMIPIGKPIDNIQLYVFDRNSNLQPVGIPGELCISGVGLARGYLNRPEITAEKFVNHPFISGERMYRTGDLARWLPDGNIEFLGRLDHQVKIRGFRIELGEIENRLLKHNSIEDAIVIDKEDSHGNKYLVAYVVGEKELLPSELREYLAGELPDYMIPSYFKQLSMIPLTANGKINRKALFDSVGDINTGIDYVAPRDQKEEILAKVWEEVLGIQKVGAKDNFFHLGGDSIKAVQVLSRLNKYKLKLEMKELFKHPTIEELSGYIKSPVRTIEQGVIQGKVKLSPFQKWLLEQSFEDKHHFNQEVMLYRKEGFDESIIQIVFSKLVQHHDALRMVFKTEAGEFIQYNRGLEGYLYSYKVFDLTNDNNYRDRITKEAESTQESIDLSNGPLVKVVLFKTKEGDHLLTVIHHLVVDGISWRIILEDFATGYMQALKGEEINFGEKTDAFKEWTDKLSAYANSKELLNEIEYWEELEGINVKKLPKDRECSDRKVQYCDHVQIKLTGEETEILLRQTYKAYNVEINDILLTALGLAFKEWAGTERVLIDLEGHGREEVIKGIDVSRTIGWFTVQYPIVLDMSGNDLSHQIKYVKENLRNIPNKGMGYSILKHLTTSENSKRLKFNLTPEIRFNYLGQFDEDIDNGVFQVSSILVGKQVSSDMESSYAIDIVGMVSEGKFFLTFTYSRNEYESNSIKELAACFRGHLIDIIKHCAAKEFTELTPSDFSLKKLSFESLENVLSNFE